MGIQVTSLPESPIVLSLSKINKDGTAFFEPIHIDESCGNQIVTTEDLWRAQWLVAYRVDVDDVINGIAHPIVTYIEAVLEDGRLYKVDLNQCNITRMESRLEEMIDWSDFWQDYEEDIIGRKEEDWEDRDEAEE